MKLRRRFLSALIPVVAALLPFVAAGTPVHADGFCVFDPLVTITTPAGNKVDVHVTVGAYGAQHIPALQAVQIRHTETERADHQSTAVEIDVFVPTDAFGPFDYQSIASSGAGGTGTVYATTWAPAGSTATLQFILNVP